MVDMQFRSQTTLSPRVKKFGRIAVIALLLPYAFWIVFFRPDTFDIFFIFLLVGPPAVVTISGIQQKEWRFLGAAITYIMINHWSGRGIFW